MTAVGFDLTLLDTAASTSAEMAALLSQSTTDRKKENVNRIIRDKAYTYVKQALDEVRACGQFVFWRDDARSKGYVSQYFKNRRKKNTTETTETKE